jgi:branched-chain amino acid transport system substrate-binding protein
MRLIGAILCALAAAATVARAELILPVMVPLTGALALEGTSQRNGALLAIEQHKAAGGAPVRALVLDTGSNPQTASQAFARALAEPGLVAALGPIDGNSMLALIPMADEAKLPLLTVSGTVAVTERGSAHVFRFFPSDRVVKAAQARFTVEELKRRRVALLYQNTAYGQSGRAELARRFAALGAAIVYEASVTLGTREMAPLLQAIRAAGADAIVLQLHSGSTALFVQQAARARLGLPIVAGSAMHQPSTAALIELEDLAGVCAETASAPAAENESPAARDFARAYRARFADEADAFALAAYDAVRFVLAAYAVGARSAAAMRERLAAARFTGAAGAYRAAPGGDLAHGAVIVCYDGKSRVPRIVTRYDAPAG